MELQVNGNTAYAYTAGRPLDPARPSIVFVHGAANDHTAFLLQSRYFAYHGHNALAAKVNWNISNPVSSQQCALDAADPSDPLGAGADACASGDTFTLTNADRDRVLLLANLGVAFLMFALGVEFSLDELLEVRRIALIAGAIQLPLTIALGIGACATSLLAGRQRRLSRVMSAWRRS